MTVTTVNIGACFGDPEKTQLRPGVKTEARFGEELLAVLACLQLIPQTVPQEQLAVRLPEQTLGESPGQLPVQSPMVPSAQAPVQLPADAPAEMPAQAPVQVLGLTLVPQETSPTGQQDEALPVRYSLPSSKVGERSPVLFPLPQAADLLPDGLADGHGRGTPLAEVKRTGTSQTHVAVKRIRPSTSFVTQAVRLESGTREKASERGGCRQDSAQIGVHTELHMEVQAPAGEVEVGIQGEPPKHVETRMVEVPERRKPVANELKLTVDRGKQSEVTVKLALHRDEVKGKLSAGDRDMRHELQASLGDLKKQLADSGVRAEALEVDTSPGGWTGECGYGTQDGAGGAGWHFDEQAPGGHSGGFTKGRELFVPKRPKEGTVDELV